MTTMIGRYDEELARALKAQRKDGRRNYQFYRSREWRDLRRRILDESHHECAWCKTKSPAVYSRAVTVHHMAHVDVWPGWALSRYYYDADSKIWMTNLVPLCHDCHDVAHGRFAGHVHDTTNDVTEERW